MTMADGQTRGDAVRTMGLGTAAAAVGSSLLILATLHPAPLAGQEDPRELEEVAVIGRLSGDPHLEFGDVAGIDVDPEQGTIFLFDGIDLELSAFMASGAFLTRAGGRGAGPGGVQERQCARGA